MASKWDDRSIAWSNIVIIRSTVGGGYHTTCRIKSSTIARRLICRSLVPYIYIYIYIYICICLEIYMPPSSDNALALALRHDLCGLHRLLYLMCVASSMRDEGDTPWRRVTLWRNYSLDGGECAARSRTSSRRVWSGPCSSDATYDASGMRRTVDRLHAWSGGRLALSGPHTSSCIHSSRVIT